MPLDPENLEALDGNSEHSWGPGMFPPGIANNEGQSRHQGDFGLNMYPPRGRDIAGDQLDNYARAVADRRTDSLDPTSERDFETLGNPDRYGGQPALVRDEPESTRPTPQPEIRPKLERKG